MINVDFCTFSIDEILDDKKTKCEGCGKYFLYEKKGRKPKFCEWYKEKLSLAAEEFKKQKSDDKRYVSIPNLESIKSIDQLKEGMVVYYVSPFISSEIIKKQYSREYKILKINKEDGLITIVRNVKSSHVNYPTIASFEKFFIKNGSTIIEKQIDLGEEDLDE